MVVLPPELIPELNTLSQNVINSRRSHSTTLLGHLNGINVVLETSFHVKILLNKVTPSLPRFFKPAASRIQGTMVHEFPQSTTTWTAVQPLDKVALCISRATTLMTFGAPTCDDPELIRTFVDHAENGNLYNKSKLYSFSDDHHSFFRSICHAISSMVFATLYSMVVSGQVASAQDLADPEEVCCSKGRAELARKSDEPFTRCRYDLIRRPWGEEFARG